jgi:tetraacyldisaccharide 4'-kinase
MLKTPSWYYKENPPLYRWALWPLSLLFGLAHNIRWASAKTPYRAKAKVISIGNISVGGSAKTPVARALAHSLKTKGYRGLILSRGYGGSQIGPLLIDPNQHDAAMVGDEPLMLSHGLDVMIAKNRADGLRRADEMGYEIVILDDAHQNPSIHKDLSLVLIDALNDGGHLAFGDHSLLPMGPLREPLFKGIKRADHILFIVPSVNQVIHNSLLSTLSRFDRPQQKIVLRSDPNAQTHRRVHAFAGIAKPWRFHQSLIEHGFEITAFDEFADHEPISSKRLSQLRTIAKASQSALITTEKDYYRLNAHDREGIDILPLEALLPSSFVEGLIDQLGLKAPISRL